MFRVQLPLALWGLDQRLVVLSLACCQNASWCVGAGMSLLSLPLYVLVLLQLNAIGGSLWPSSTYMPAFILVTATVMLEPLKFGTNDGRTQSPVVVSWLSFSSPCFLSPFTHLLVWKSLDSSYIMDSGALCASLSVILFSYLERLWRLGLSSAALARFGWPAFPYATTIGM